MSLREDLQARIAVARAETDRLEKEREDRAELAELEATAAKAERDAKDAKVIVEIEEKHGVIDGVRLVRVDTELGVVVLKRANHLIYKRFRDAGEAKTEDLEKLVRPCLVHPDKSAFDAMVEDVPAILDRCANAIVKLAGFRMKEVAGK